MAANAMRAHLAEIGLVVGATAVIRHSKPKDTPLVTRLRGLLDKTPVRLVSVALANKTARVIWALMAHDRPYHPHHAAKQ